jgi:SulP family sulfate permease
MSEVVEIQTDIRLIDEDVDDFAGLPGEGGWAREKLPPGVEVFQLSGPFFFGVANRLSDVLERTGKTPRVYILRMRLVPMIDATGASALREFSDRCRRQGTAVILSGVQVQPRSVLRYMGLTGEGGPVLLASSFERALELSRTFIQ